jgi:hypothetical protein
MLTSRATSIPASALLRRRGGKGHRLVKAHRKRARSQHQSGQVCRFHRRSGTVRPRRSVLWVHAVGR